MQTKIAELIKKKDLTIPSVLFYNITKLNISHYELLILIYFINNKSMFNPKEISKNLNMTLNDVLETVSNLKEKKLITIELKEINKKCEEHIDLNLLYKNLSMLISASEEKEEIVENTIYALIEESFGRLLSPIEYQIISGWLEIGYTNELIGEALKEAKYNDVLNIKYIDKILYNWSKKGITKKEENLKTIYEVDQSDLISDDIMEYDWLNDD